VSGGNPFLTVTIPAGYVFEADCCSTVERRNTADAATSDLHRLLQLLHARYRNCIRSPACRL